MVGVLFAQMFDHGDHMGGWGWGWGVLIMILIVALIALIVWGIIWATRRVGGRTGGHPHHRAREILAERLARGEITPEEYQEISRHL
jgi:putative membrane protein